MQVLWTLNGRVFMYENWTGWEDLTVTSVNSPSLVLLKKICQKSSSPKPHWEVRFNIQMPWTLATCQLPVLHCFYGMRICRMLKMALYFEQLVLIWFVSIWTAHYTGNICVWYSISLLSNSQSYLNFLHSFVAFHGTFWHSTQICSGTLAFQYVY